MMIGTPGDQGDRVRGFALKEENTGIALQGISVLWRLEGSLKGHCRLEVFRCCLFLGNAHSPRERRS